MQFILSLVLLSSTATSGVAPLRWLSPNNSKPLSFAEWHSKLEPQPFRVKPLISPRRLDSRVDFFVEETLANALRPALETLAIDIERETVAVAVFSFSGNSAESLKALLRREHATGMSSAVFVGDLPIAWFQMIDDFNGDTIGEGYEEFPCDLFFMDLDGSWQDSFVKYDTFDSLIPGSDSIYDIHRGSITPEITVSRLPASKIGAAESLLTAYLDRDHRYRNGQLPVTDRALVYIDDDWEPWAADWDSNVGLLYPSRVPIYNPESTRIADYQPRIDSADYQWIALMSHSWPGGHAMKYDSGRQWDWFHAETIPALDPHASFYNLFACSNVRFVENGYCGGRYVFQTTSGLGAIGSTKTGSMLSFDLFYDPLGRGKTLGEAFKDWFQAILEDGCDPGERSWFYGMCLVADGSLKPRLPQSGIAEERRDMTEMPGISYRVPSIKLLGNPALGRLGFDLDLSLPASCRIGLYDKTGRLAAELPLQPYSAGPHRINMDASALPAGVYFLKVTAGTASTRLPVTIIH
jgi:hypothetical protein